MNNFLPLNTLSSRFVATAYEPFLAMGERRGMRANRAALLGGARGRVLEIGAGTGLNLPHYPREAGELILTEPVPAMYRRLQQRAAGISRATAIQATGSAVPLEDASVDTVVSTLVLCTVPEMEPVIAEITRVLKPGGILLFCEHVLSSQDRLARRQRRFARLWAAFAGGCRCDRDIVSTLAGQFDFKDLEEATWRGMPSLVKPLVIGTAVRS